MFVFLGYEAFKYGIPVAESTPILSLRENTNRSIFFHVSMVVKNICVKRLEKCYLSCNIGYFRRSV